MRTPPFLTFSLLFAPMCVLVWGANSPAGPDIPQSETPDSFKAFDVYTKAFGAMDINDDPILDCLWARRENYDPVHKSVTYVWSVAGTNGSGRKDVPFHFTEGDTPDTAKFTVESDESEDSGVAKVLYTDYTNCSVMEVPHFGGVCTLWVNDRLMDAVPEYCIQVFTDICGNGVSLRSAEKCANVGV